MTKFKSTFVVVAVFLISLLGPSVSFAQSSTQNMSNNNILPDLDLVSEIEEAVKENVSFDKDELSFEIKNEKQLKDVLSKVDGVSYSKVKADLNKFESALNSDTGQKVISALDKLSGKIESESDDQIMMASAGCGAYTAITYAHPTLVGGLATAAGVSGPVGWGVAAGMGALYTGGSYLVC